MFYKASDNWKLAITYNYEMIFDTCKMRVSCKPVSSFSSTSCGLYKQCYCVLFCFLINSHIEDTTNVMVLSYLSEYQRFKYLYFLHLTARQRNVPTSIAQQLASLSDVKQHPHQKNFSSEWQWKRSEAALIKSRQRNPSNFADWSENTGGKPTLKKVSYLRKLHSVTSVTFKKSQPYL